MFNLLTSLRAPLCQRDEARREQIQCIGVFWEVFLTKGGGGNIIRKASQKAKKARHGGDRTQLKQGLEIHEPAVQSMGPLGTAVRRRAVLNGAEWQLNPSPGEINNAAYIFSSSLI